MTMPANHLHVIDPKETPEFALDLEGQTVPTETQLDRIERKLDAILDLGNSLQSSFNSAVEDFANTIGSGGGLGKLLGMFSGR